MQLCKEPVYIQCRWVGVGMGHVACVCNFPLQNFSVVTVLFSVVGIDKDSA